MSIPYLVVQTSSTI